MRNYTNITNCITEIDINNINKFIDLVKRHNLDSVFGIEFHLEKQSTKIFLISPAYIRFKNSEINTAYRLEGLEGPLNGFNFYEGYLSCSYFKPLYGEGNGKYVDDMINLSNCLPDGEKIYVQWLFKKANRKWQENALDMFESYLNGNDEPSTNKIIRKIQDKGLSILSKISSTRLNNNYIDFAEDKIIEDGFYFQLRVITSPNIKRELIYEPLNNYTFYNSLRLQKIEPTARYTEFFSDCVLTGDRTDEILSVKEVLSLFLTSAGKPQTYHEDNGNEKLGNNKTSPIELLPTHTDTSTDTYVSNEQELISNITDALKRVKIISQARVYNTTVTRGVRLDVVQFDIPKNKNITDIEKRKKDIKAALGIENLSIEQGNEPDTVRFLIPNQRNVVVNLKDMLEEKSFQDYRENNPLAFIVGVDEIGNPIYLSLTKLRHLLIAGTSGSGKSVFLNSLAVTLILNHSEDELQILMIDPKIVELQQYKGLPHVQDVVVNMDEAVNYLNHLVNEMENRYKIFANVNVKDIRGYNNKMRKENNKIMPYIVCFIDEYADLHDTNAEVEEYVVRLGQMARGAGIHLVIATQRPDSKVISGRIKSNIPNAISFNLSNNNNYRTVFGTGINYTLLGNGDGVMKIEGYHKEFQRFQSPIISVDSHEEEIFYQNLANYFKGRIKIDEHIDIQDANNTTEHTESNDNDDYNRLKLLIAQTKETRIEPLRKELGIKTALMKELMGRLVEDGWLIKHKSTKKGYELVVSEDELKEFCQKMEDEN